jgi:hypothetical protein
MKSVQVLRPWMGRGDSKKKVGFVLRVVVAVHV